MISRPSCGCKTHDRPWVFGVLGCTAAQATGERAAGLPLRPADVAQRFLDLVGIGPADARRLDDADGSGLRTFLADALVVVHLLFVAFVMAGGFLLLRWPGLAGLHLPAALWGA